MAMSMAMTKTMVLLAVLVITLPTMPTRSMFVASFSTTTKSATSNDYWFARRSTARRRSGFHHCQQCQCAKNDNDNDGGDNIAIGCTDGDDIRENSKYRLDTVPALDTGLDEIDAFYISTISSTRDNDNKNNNAATTVSQSAPYSTTVARIIEALVSIKEKVYGIVRKLFSDLVTIIKRSATKARDWAMEDDIGQLVSSSLALIGFFAFVAAFAAWNIEVLSGGKSKWSGPKNGVTIPVVRGLPDVVTFTTTTGGRGEIESPVVVRFQKPKWKAPKIQTLTERRMLK
jgi:hypothetical protein